MRITLDLDSPSPYKMLWTAIKGMVILRRRPHIRMTFKGWHVLYYGLNMTQEEAYEYRRRLGDDEKRVDIDMSASEIRIRQVLFSKGGKVTKIRRHIPWWWFKLMKQKRTSPILHLKTFNRNPPLIGRMVWRYNRCPCGKIVDMAHAHWEIIKNNYQIKIHHADGSPPCEYPLTHGIRLLAKRLVGAG